MRRARVKRGVLEFGGEGERSLNLGGGLDGNCSATTRSSPRKHCQAVVHVLAECGGKQLAAQGVLAHLHVVALLRDEIDFLKLQFRC